MITLAKKDRSKMTAAALGKIPCDLSIENARIINVFTGEIMEGAVDILEGIIVRIREKDQKSEIPSKQILNANKRYLLPGFIDTHLHIESSLMVPENCGKAVAIWGTTTIVTDPHEIANVHGIKGVDYMLKNARKSPINIFTLVPSCVPSLPGLESAGADLQAKKVGKLLDEDGVIGVAEVMDYYGVINDEKRMHDIIIEAEKRRMFIQGHSPTFTGNNLNAYLCGGPKSDHEAVTAEEIYAKRKLGMLIDLRIHSPEQAKSLLKGVEPGLFKDAISLCSDDVNAHRLIKYGSLSRALADLIQEGLDPLMAIRFATYNAAREYEFSDIGAIGPGYCADLQLVDDLTFVNHPHLVFSRGKIIAVDGHYQGDVLDRAKCNLGNSINYININGADDFRIKAEGKSSRQVMVVNEGYQNNTPVYETLQAKGDYLELPSNKNVNYVCVLNRYGKANKTICLYRDFGLKNGALASSIGHDCHNLCIIYTDPEDAYKAVESLKECGGGVCYVKEGEVKALMELPVAGLMSDLPLAQIAAKCEKLEEIIGQECGVENYSLHSLNGIVFCTLPVFERYTPTDLGVVDGPRKRFVEYIK